MRRIARASQLGKGAAPAWVDRHPIRRLRPNDHAADHARIGIFEGGRAAAWRLVTAQSLGSCRVGRAKRAPRLHANGARRRSSHATRSAPRDHRGGPLRPRSPPRVAGLLHSDLGRVNGDWVRNSAEEPVPLESPTLPSKGRGRHGLSTARAVSVSRAEGVRSSPEGCGGRLRRRGRLANAAWSAGFHAISIGGHNQGR